MIENTYSIIPTFVMDNDNLSSNEKLLYGRISSLSNKRGYCFASNAYFAEKFKTTQRCIQKWLKKLKEENLIEIEFAYVKGTKQVEKRLIRQTLFVHMDMNDNSGGGEPEFVTGGEPEFVDNNISNSNNSYYPINNISINNSDGEQKEEKFACGEFKNVYLTEAQAEKLEHEVYGNIEDLKVAVQILDTYIENSPKGKKYKNHYAVLCKHNWVYPKVYQNKQTAPIKRGELY